MNDQIIDFNCDYDNLAGINPEISKALNLRFPDAYLFGDLMAEVSKALMEKNKLPFCVLPFCHTVEAEAMGGSIKYGDESAGPRAREYVCSSLEEILLLPEIDFSKGRIHEVLIACEQLRKQGFQVVLEVSGPFSILGCLIDMKYVFRGMRKNQELILKIFEKVERELLRYIKEAGKYGIEIFSYADPAAAVSIVGPRVAQQIVELFTYPFIKKMSDILDENSMFLLCPKTTLSLIGTGKAKFVDIEIEEAVPYAAACLQMKGTIKFAGQMCIKNIEYTLENKKIKEVVII